MNKTNDNVATIREFQQNIYKCLKTLPLVVTKNGKDYIRITEINVATDVLEEKEDVATKSKQLSPPSKSKTKLIPIGTMCKHSLTYHEGCHT